MLVFAMAQKKGLEVVEISDPEAPAERVLESMRLP